MRPDDAGGASSGRRLAGIPEIRKELSEIIKIQCPVSKKNVGQMGAVASRMGAQTRWIVPGSIISSIEEPKPCIPPHWTSEGTAVTPQCPRCPRPPLLPPSTPVRTHCLVMPGVHHERRLPPSRKRAEHGIFGQKQSWRGKGLKCTCVRVRSRQLVARAHIQTTKVHTTSAAPPLFTTSRKLSCLPSNKTLPGVSYFSKTSSTCFSRVARPVCDGSPKRRGCALRSSLSWSLNAWS